MKKFITYMLTFVTAAGLIFPTTVLADDATVHPLKGAVKEARKEFHADRKAAGADFRSKITELKGKGEKEKRDVIKTQLLPLAIQYMNAMIEDAKTFVQTVSDKVAVAPIFTKDEAARTQFIADLKAVSDKLTALESQVSAATDFATLKNVRQTFRDDLHQLRDVIKAIRQKVQSLRPKATDSGSETENS